MDYIEVRFYCKPEISEILLAWLSETPFTMFEDYKDGLSAYIPSGDFDEQILLDCIEKAGGKENIKYEKSLIKDQNWNKQWEQNFEAVRIDNRVHVRAPFHPKENAEIEILLEPKMAFGTGHHSTTSEVMRIMLDMDFTGKKVLDMGCGSGILAILAAKRGATELIAIDNDDWAVANAIENFEKNNCEAKIIKGDASSISGLRFDIILANINRNILLQDIPEYAKCLDKAGKLVLSGYLDEDIGLIEDKANQHGLRSLERRSNKGWVTQLFVKS